MIENENINILIKHSTFLKILFEIVDSNASHFSSPPKEAQNDSAMDLETTFAQTSSINSSIFTYSFRLCYS